MFLSTSNNSKQMNMSIKKGNLVKIFSHNSEDFESHFVTRLDRPEDIDVATNSIIIGGFSNVDYTKWPSSEENAIWSNNSPASRHAISTESIGIVIGTVLVKYAGVHHGMWDKDHWKVLIGEHVYLLPADKITLVKE